MRQALLLAALAGSVPVPSAGADECPAALAEEDKPECWFLHGSGETCGDGPCPEPTSSREMVDGLPYWGDFGGARAMPCCKSLRFNHEDTVHQKFDAPALRQSVCSQLCGGPGCTIQDKVIFTHSAANLYLAAAFDYGDCLLGSSSEWYAVNAPLLGSKVAAEGPRVCRGDGIVDRVERAAAVRIMGEDQYCSVGNTTLNPMYDSMRPDYSYVAPDGAAQPLSSGVLRDVMSLYVSGSMCGDDSNGITCPGGRLSHCAKDDAGLCALAKLVYSRNSLPGMNCCTPHSKTGTCAPLPHGVVDNDGMVGWESCALPDKTYVESWGSRYYRMHGNHEDGTCVNGDWDKTGNNGQWPCRWYQSMAAAAATARVGQRFACASNGQGGCERNAEGSYTTEAECLQQCGAPVPPGQSTRSGDDLQKFVIVAVAVAAGVALAAGGAFVARRRRRGNAERLLPASDATMAGSE